MEDLEQRLAELAVKVGANVQPGQLVGVACQPGKEGLTRAIAAEAYKAGAKFVDVAWFDPWVKRARIEYAADDTLDYVPPWLGGRLLHIGEQNGATIALSGPSAPDALQGLDPVRSGRDHLPRVKESAKIVGEQLVNWTVVPGPNATWAQLVYPDLEPDAALAKLWEAIAHICRLDTDDPAAAWKARVADLVSAADRLAGHHFDALHYEGPGTDLTIGLLPGHQWIAGGMETSFGVFHQANIPTEEVFTSPDPQRADGVVSASMPLVLIDGTVVNDLVIRFEGGRITELTASSAEDTMRTIIAQDEGASRLGECALVDGSGRIGALGTVFFDTLIDENAASHLAIGVGFPFTVPGDVASRINTSETHIDFMIGRPELTVTGVAANGTRTPVLVGGDWQI